MSEIQVYGSTVLSSSFYDTGCDNIQFPLFRLAPNLKVAGLGHNIYPIRCIYISNATDI